MHSLHALTERVEAGDTLAWVGEKSFDDCDQVRPRTVTGVERDGDEIRVDAEGIRGGSYYYIVDRAGGSEAFYVYPGGRYSQSMGSVAFARLTESTDPVTVRKGYFDDRERSG